MVDINVTFTEESLRHYCMRNLPGLNDSLTLDHLDCAISLIKGEACPLCEEFNQAITEAIVREAQRRIE